MSPTDALLIAVTTPSIPLADVTLIAVLLTKNSVVPPGIAPKFRANWTSLNALAVTPDLSVTALIASAIDEAWPVSEAPTNTSLILISLAVRAVPLTVSVSNFAPVEFSLKPRAFTSPIVPSPLA